MPEDPFDELLDALTALTFKYNFSKEEGEVLADLWKKASNENKILKARLKNQLKR